MDGPDKPGHDNKALNGLIENAGMQQLLERFRPVTHGVFPGRIDLGKSLLHTVGYEDRIIAEAMVAAWRKGQAAMHLALKRLNLAGRHRDTKRADEFRGAGPHLLTGQ